MKILINKKKTVKSPRNVFKRTAPIPNSVISPPYQKKKKKPE